ncbi:MAG TPA: aspartate aminotransferase family protein [Lichenihabitans sp.]|jgi:4-aminobutyrate aminotransferase-like enzyme|nr:aspartate aminotransferase family protein [Lichenihabitans sp.]
MDQRHGMVNAFDPARTAALPEADAALVERRQRLLGPAYRLFYDHPVHLVRGEGVWLYDAAGAAYLDVYNNVPVVGHCHPRVVDAMARQAGALNTHTRYLHGAILDYAEALLTTVPAELGHVMFTCTGSEANDLALRVAKSATGGTGFIVTANAYHGVTDAVAGLSPSLGPAVAPAPHVVCVAAPDRRRGGDVGAAFAAEIDAALERMAAKGIRPAALIVDTIFSSDGVFADPPGFLRPAVECIRAAGGLFIADEVQAGFGRTGAGLWGFARHQVVPDLVTMGKPMGNGHPVAAMLARPALLERFGAASRYFNTFGGNPVSIAVAQAVLDVIAEENLVARARETGDYLMAELAARAAPHPGLGEVRGSGLFIGLDVLPETAETGTGECEAARIVNGLRERRVLISASGPTGNVLKIRPPLPFGRPEAEIFLDAFDDVLKTIG